MPSGGGKTAEGQGEAQLLFLQGRVGRLYPGQSAGLQYEKRVQMPSGGGKTAEGQGEAARKRKRKEEGKREAQFLLLQGRTGRLYPRQSAGL